MELQRRYESITKRWWFYVLILLIFSIPSYAAKGVDSADSPQLVMEVLSHALIFSYPVLMPIFKIIPIILLIGIIFYNSKMTRPFDIYVSFNLGLIALFENMAVTEKYGFAALTGNIIVYLLVAATWAWDAIVKQNDFAPQVHRPVWRYWVLLPTFLAFWAPIDMETLKPNFNPLYILTSDAGLASCYMIPVYLSVLTLYYPKVNMVTFKVTAFAGLVTGILAVIQFFALHSDTWWLGVLHLPLLIVSVYAILLERLMKSPGKVG